MAKNTVDEYEQKSGEGASESLPQIYDESYLQWLQEREAEFLGNIEHALVDEEEWDEMSPSDRINHLNKISAIHAETFGYRPAAEVVIASLDDIGLDAIDEDRINIGAYYVPFSGITHTASWVVTDSGADASGFTFPPMYGVAVGVIAHESLHAFQAHLAEMLVKVEAAENEAKRELGFDEGQELSSDEKNTLQEEVNRRLQTEGIDPNSKLAVGLREGGALRNAGEEFRNSLENYQSYDGTHQSWISNSVEHDAESFGDSVEHFVFSDPEERYQIRVDLNNQIHGIGTEDVYHDEGLVSGELNNIIKEYYNLSEEELQSLQGDWERYQITVAELMDNGALDGSRNTAVHEYGQRVSTFIEARSEFYEIMDASVQEKLEISDEELETLKRDNPSLYIQMARTLINEGALDQVENPLLHDYREQFMYEMEEVIKEAPEKQSKELVGRIDNRSDFHDVAEGSSKIETSLSGSESTGLKRLSGEFKDMVAANKPVHEQQDLVANTGFNKALSTITPV